MCGRNTGAIGFVSAAESLRATRRAPRMASAYCWTEERVAAYKRPQFGQWA